MQSRFTVVPLGIHTRVAILFSHRPANAKRRTPPRRTRIYARRLFQYFRHRPLPTDCFLDLDAKYLPSFRAVEWKKSFKSATILLNLFNFSSFFFFFPYYNFFSCFTFEKLFTWNCLG